MKYFVFIIMVLVSTEVLAGWFGGLDVDEIQSLQEKTYQYGRSCLRGDRLNSCENFVGKYGETVELIAKHQDEIHEKADEGDPDCKQILHNLRRIGKLAETIRLRN